MKHYYARQRPYDYRWEFVVDSDGLVYPAGYCVGVIDLEDPELIESLGGRDSIAYDYYVKKVTPFLHMFHVNGHDSKEEACACYRRYLLDNRTSLDIRMDKEQECLICGLKTLYMASVDGMSYVLCDGHRNTDELSGLLPVLLELFV